MRDAACEEVIGVFWEKNMRQINTPTFVFLPWFPLSSIEEAEMLFTEKYLQTYCRTHGYRYAVCLREDQIPIGYVRVNMEDDSFDFGYGLRSTFWQGKS